MSALFLRGSTISASLPQWFIVVYLPTCTSCRLFENFVPHCRLFTSLPWVLRTFHSSSTSLPLARYHTLQCEPDFPMMTLSDAHFGPCPFLFLVDAPGGYFLGPLTTIALFPSLWKKQLLQFHGMQSEFLIHQGLLLSSGSFQSTLIPSSIRFIYPGLLSPNGSF